MLELRAKLTKDNELTMDAAGRLTALRQLDEKIALQTETTDALESKLRARDVQRVAPDGTTIVCTLVVAR